MLHLRLFDVIWARIFQTDHSVITHSQNFPAWHGDSNVFHFTEDCSCWPSVHDVASHWAFLNERDNWLRFSGNVLFFEFSVCTRHFSQCYGVFLCFFFFVVHNFHRLFSFLSPLSSSPAPCLLSSLSPLLSSPPLSVVVSVVVVFFRSCVVVVFSVLCCCRFLCPLLLLLAAAVAASCCCCRRCSWVMRVLERLLFVSWQMFAIPVHFLRHLELVITMMMDAVDCSISLVIVLLIPSVHHGSWR